jgi:type IV pilus assembly protein PilC
MENAVKLRGKVKAAMSYPIFVAIFFLFAIVGLIFFLVPKFKAMFAQFGAQLPLPTRITVAVSETLIHNLPIAILLLAGAITGIVMFYRTPKGRLVIDKFMLAAPLLGPMFAKIVMARFFQTLATLIKSGNDIVSSLDISATTTDNAFMEKEVEQIKKRVVEGSTLSEELGRHPIFPSMVVRMAAVGEKSGQLDELFYRVSEYYNDEVDAIVSSMSAIIEPVLIVLLGGVVGVFIITMYLPIFKLAAAVMNKQ